MIMRIDSNIFQNRDSFFPYFYRLNTRKDVIRLA